MHLPVSVGMDVKSDFINPVKAFAKEYLDSIHAKECGF
jgi:hypothetical protein